MFALSNAVKYTNLKLANSQEDRSYVTDNNFIELKVVKNEIEGIAIVQVIDCGMGMTPAEHNMLFEPLKPSKSREKVGGLGLGAVTVLLFLLHISSNTY